MNHSGHDDHMMNDYNTHMDHSAHHNVHAGHMKESDHMAMGHMQMNFHFGFNEIILFSFWNISSVEGLLGSILGIFILAMGYEGLKYLREYLFWKNYSSLQYRTVQGPADKPGNEANNSRVVNLVPEVGHKLMPTFFSKHHVIQTFLHIVQVFVSYLLMLIFMTYNVWLCLAVILGAGTGYFLFCWRKALFVDVTEHCH